MNNEAGMMHFFAFPVQLGELTSPQNDGVDIVLIKL